MSKKTIDRYPNYIGFEIEVPTGHSTQTTEQISMPIPRLQTKNRAQVIEILWVQGRAVTYYAPDNQIYNTLSIYSGSPSTLDVGYQDPRCIIQKSFSNDTNATVIAPFTGNIYYSDDFRVDTMSQDGYGFLYAGDKLNATLTADNGNLGTKYYVRIYYRFVDVSVQEYVGLVQSLQS